MQKVVQWTPAVTETVLHPPCVRTTVGIHSTTVKYIYIVIQVSLEQRSEATSAQLYWRRYKSSKK